MKLIITTVLLLFFSTSYSQWTRVEQLPSSDFFTVYHKDDTLYAGGRSIIYISRDKGLTWESTAIPELSLVNSIIVYRNELFAAGSNTGVFKSSDGGRTWQNISAGIFPDVSDFCEYKGDLYAATFGNAVYKLDPAARRSWLPFGNGLSNLSANLPAIAGNSNALVAGTLANGMYDLLQANSTTWEERFLTGRVDPNEGAYDIIDVHDTLVYSGRTGKYYMSTDNGLNWNLFGNRLASLYGPIVNARQALLTSAYFFDGANFNTAFLYIKKDALQNSFVNFSVVINHFNYKIDILGDKLWDASDRGLFFMSLSNLPGISADDPVILTSLPFRFTLFSAKCANKKVVLTWKTAQEQDSHHFDIEKSEDGIHWTVLIQVPAAGNSTSERSYSFIDNDPVQKNYYRIVEYDLNGRSEYTSILQSSCNTANVFNVWPNPVHDKTFININTDNSSQVLINVFDSKGALIKTQKAAVFQGINHYSVDMRSLANGIYSLFIEWNDGQMRKTVQIVKQ